MLLELFALFYVQIQTQNISTYEIFYKIKKGKIVQNCTKTKGTKFYKVRLYAMLD